MVSQGSGLYSFDLISEDEPQPGDVVLRTSGVYRILARDFETKDYPSGVNVTSGVLYRERKWD